MGFLKFSSAPPVLVVFSLAIIVFGGIQMKRITRFFQKKETVYLFSASKPLCAETNDRETSVQRNNADPSALKNLSKTDKDKVSRKNIKQDGTNPVKDISDKTVKHDLSFSKEKRDTLDTAKEATLFALKKELEGERLRLEDRARKLREKEMALQILLKEIKERVVDLKRLNQNLESRAKKQISVDRTYLTKIVKIYETMRPQEAALILKSTPLSVLFYIFEEMNGRKAAAILANLDPHQAARVTSGLADRRAILP